MSDVLDESPDPATEETTLPHFDGQPDADVIDVAENEHGVFERCRHEWRLLTVSNATTPLGTNYSIPVFYCVHCLAQEATTFDVSKVEQAIVRGR